MGLSQLINITGAIGFLCLVSMLQCYIRETTESRFLYCVRGFEREFFSFFFWAVPFDLRRVGFGVGTFWLPL
jgi:hypothetical protein